MFMRQEKRDKVKKELRIQRNILQRGCSPTLEELPFICPLSFMSALTVPWDGRGGGGLPAVSSCL